uniref:DUF2039 domain-containing protein n=1 Tax=Macrostomum lignano TaxID=282301 RepID=A0A1I8HSX3_9PLAT
MSSQRGNANRNRPQKHQNSHAFKNSIHDTSQRTKTVNQLNFGGLTCQRCKDILDWKVKYKKYKLPTQPRKCVRCEKRCIQSAYFTVCQSCARERAECQKCAQQRELTPAEAPSVANQSAGAAAAAAASLDGMQQRANGTSERFCDCCRRNGSRLPHRLRLGSGTGWESQMMGQVMTESMKKKAKKTINEKCLQLGIVKLTCF